MIEPVGSRCASDADFPVMGKDQICPHSAAICVADGRQVVGPAGGVRYNSKRCCSIVDSFGEETEARIYLLRSIEKDRVLMDGATEGHGVRPGIPITLSSIESRLVSVLIGDERRPAFPGRSKELPVPLREGTALRRNAKFGARLSTAVVLLEDKIYDAAHCIRSIQRRGPVGHHLYTINCWQRDSRYVDGIWYARDGHAMTVG